MVSVAHIFAISLPILGAIVCVARRIHGSSRISDLQAVALKHAENTAVEAERVARSRRLSPEETAKMLVVARPLCSEIKNKSRSPQQMVTKKLRPTHSISLRYSKCRLCMRFAATNPRPHSRRSGRQNRGEKFDGHPGGGRFDWKNFSRRRNLVSSKSAQPGLFSERAIRADYWRKAEADTCISLARYFR